MDNSNSSSEVQCRLAQSLICKVGCSTTQVELARTHAQVDLDELAGLISRAIAKHRLESGMTHEQVAEMLGVGNEAVSRMDRGLVMRTVARLVELAEISAAMRPIC